jgi:hypothetical protein
MSLCWSWCFRYPANFGTLITEGSNTEFNPLNHMHRNSLECWEAEKKNAKCAECWSWCFKHPAKFGTPCYRGPQHWVQSIEPHTQKFTRMLEKEIKIAKWAQCWSWCFKHPTNFGIPSLPRAPTLSSIHWATRIEIHQNVRRKKIELQNELSIGAGASSFQPILEPPRYRGPQHWAQSIDSLWVHTMGGS